MATPERIRAALEISRIAMQVSIQGKYHMFADYAGHVDSLVVYAYPAEGRYDQMKDFLPGWSCSDAGRRIYLDTCTDEQINALYADARSLLATDADGIPV